jgi:phosphatidylserine decarboxylase
MSDRNRGANVTDWLRALPLYALPHHVISRLIGRLAREHWPPLKDGLIKAFMRAYAVDMGEATNARSEDYPNFNAFFTRALVDGARPLPDDPNAIACPADGTLSQWGPINGDRLFQAKGRHYGLSELVVDQDLSARLKDGHFATVYLAPPNYHRVHMPVGGALTGMAYAPGRLFSVAPHTVRTIPGLFARNERVVAIFETAAGPMAVILVGAVCVAGIETAWYGLVTPPPGREPARWDYSAQRPPYARGDEIGRFHMGSTAIVLLPRGTARWRDDLEPGATLRMGQTLGTLTEPGS